MALTPQDLELLAGLTEEQLLATASPEEIVALHALLEGLEVDDSWEPTPRQARALEFCDLADEVFYGGSQGGGKTVLALQHAYRLSNKHDGHRTLILRRTFPEVRKSLIPPSLRMYDPKRAKFLVGEFTWRFDNGSTIEFGHMEGPYDWVRYMGSEYDLIIWDELTHFTEEMYTEVNTRCRTTKTRRRKGIRPHVLATSNPGGVGHTWVKERFIEPAEPETPFTSKSHVMVYVPARLDDNPYIDDDYRTQFDSLSPARRKALLLGDWDANDLQFFTEWNKEIHVIEPFEIPSWWPRERGLDWGHHDPFAVVWGAWNDDTIYIYKEIYERFLTTDQQVALVKQVNDGDHVSITYADTQIFAKTGHGEPIATSYARQGLPCVGAMKMRVSGWTAIRNRLVPRIDAEGVPRCRIYIFSTCRNLIKEIGALPRDPRNSEDADSDAPDHACDALRYLVMTHGRKGREPEIGQTSVDRIHHSVDRQHRRDRHARRR